MNKKIGDKRIFQFKPGEEFTIREILDKPKIGIWWIWNTGLCPHCKKRIERKIYHTFYRIEILGIEEKKDNELTIDDIVLFGDTLDKRAMVLPIDKYNEVLGKTNKFKGLVTE